MKKLATVLALTGALGAVGCATTGVDNSAGRATVYEDIRSASSVQGVGIESQDVAAIADQMARSILKNPTVMNRATAPRIIIDAEYFVNESTSRINKKLLTTHLRNNLRNASYGKLIFIERKNVEMVQKERELKRRGAVDAGTIRQTQATGGADFRLQGTIMSQDMMQQGSQQITRSNSIEFELVDMELGSIVWGDIYAFKKTAQNDIIYR